MTRTSFCRPLRLSSVVLLLGILPLAACETTPTKEATGTAIGAIAGGVIGRQVGGGSGRAAATIAGIVLGGFVGNAIGKHMDERDRQQMSQSLDNNAAGQSTTWKSDATGSDQTITPGESFVRNGQQCRRFVQEAIVDGQPKKMSGTACKRADGATWEEASYLPDASSTAGIKADVDQAGRDDAGEA